MQLPYEARQILYERYRPQLGRNPGLAEASALGEPRMDFGIAKLLRSSQDDDRQTISRQNVVLGTVAYMSPEQARGWTVDTRTDIWAFGCVLFEMLAGMPAFQGETPTDIVV